MFLKDIEIILLGQNVNSYGKDFKNGDNFARLLDEICQGWGRFLGKICFHPSASFTDVIDVVPKNEKISR